MLKLAGSVDISKTTRCGKTLGDEDKYMMTVTVRDRDSSVNVLKLEMTLHDFMMALTQTSHMPCEMEFNNSGLVGKIRENKTVTVRFPESIFDWANRDRVRELAQPLIAPYEVDGWKADFYNLSNSHYRKQVYENRKTIGYDVQLTLIRYLDRTEQ